MANELQYYRDPFQAMQDRTLRMVQQVLAGGPSGQRTQGQGESIVPPAEAIDDENSYRLTLEIPGVDPKDVEVSVIGSTLSIKAERRRQDQPAQSTQGQQGQTTQGQPGQETRARHFLFTELQHGVIRREFGLPEDADRQRITADFRNGLLNLTIPKSQEVHQRRRIEITSS